MCAHGLLLQEHVREAYETMLQTVSKHDVIEEDYLIAFLQSTTSSLGLTPVQADLLVDYLDAPDVWFLHAHTFAPSLSLSTSM